MSLVGVTPVTGFVALANWSTLFVRTPVSKSLILVWAIDGISAATKLLNVGAAADPVVGPANIAFALLVSVLLKNAPAPPIVIIELAAGGVLPSSPKP